MRLLPARIVVALTLLASVSVASAQTSAPAFSDLPATHPAYSAVQYLSALGVLKGYSDGTFRPDQKVTRSEAIKMIDISAAAAGQAFTPNTSSSYDDVPVGAWYEPYVTYAWKSLGIINGPPATTSFHGERNVTKAEFLKMFLLAQKADPNSYSEIALPLSTDVTDTSAWYFPFMRLAISSSMIMVQTDGTLNPSQELTRAQVALIMNRYLMYKANRRTQALLSATETDLVNVLKMIEDKNLEQAEYASARALVAARGALTANPDTELVQGAVKTTEAFRSLVRAFAAGSQGAFEDAVTLAKEAWALAETAKQKSASLTELSTQIQTVASKMAATARESLAGASSSGSPK